MKKIIIIINLTFLLSFLSYSFAYDGQPIPITAEEAFDMVQMNSNVALVDVRSRAEYFWVGAASQVDEIITTKEESIVPDYGKVVLSENGRHVEFYVNGSYAKLNVKKILKMNLSPIGFNIPFQTWNEVLYTLEVNTNFVDQVNKLYECEYDVVIFFCRSGGRSEDCVNDYPNQFPNFFAIYEIDQPDGESGYGGFEGTSYSNIYNGYRGYPGRLSEIQDHPSVSWKDTGLPIKTSVKSNEQNVCP